MRPDPTPASAEIAIIAHPAPAPEPGMLFSEPGENLIKTIRPEITERPFPDIPHEKFRRPGELAGKHVALRIDVCHTGTGTTSTLEGFQQIAGINKIF